MRFVPGQRQLEIAAGEFARFCEPPSAFYAGGSWRAEVGREWHTTLRRRADESGTGWAFESAVRTVWVQGKWTFVIEGRIDQLRRTGDPGSPVEVREIKTVSLSLPRPEAYWREMHGAFFIQLALYCHGLAQNPENAGREVRGILVLADPATGTIQEVILREPPAHWLAPVARELEHFAETRWTSRLRLEHLRLLNPFEHIRPEWLAAKEQLDAAAETSPVVLLEAPTGFGKTALALDFALRRLRDGEVSRIIFATGKNSGRIQVRRELERMVDAGTLHTLTLHAKDEHTLPDSPSDPAVWQENWRQHGIAPERLFATGEATLEGVRALGAEARVPPWEITRALLPSAEFILCDYNYLFSPRQAGVFTNLQGWNPAETLLLVDEAHNLPSRAAAARTLEVTSNEARETLDALRFAAAPKDWIRHWEAWLDFLGGLRRADVLDGAALYLLCDLSAEIARLIEECPPFRLELTAPVLESLFLPVQISAAATDQSGAFLTWMPREECLRAECLGAADAIGAVLGAFRRTVLMSATLAPLDAFTASCGLLPGSAAWLTCAADWRANAYDVIVDARVDTRLKARERHYGTTAEAVLALAVRGPVVVFFPSYHYAETVAVYVNALDAGFRVALQPRGATPDEHAAFVRDSLFTAHALFLVLGGGLAEGVDILGGRVDQVMVVSPGLPEVTPAQTARMAALEQRGEANAFRSVYL
ncbi:MAG: PhoH family protein, partial [Puniceicoccales bacterium]|nr:PhoH family protein [Puniceicoccales bacterium]